MNSEISQQHNVIDGKSLTNAIWKVESLNSLPAGQCQSSKDTHLHFSLDKCLMLSDSNFRNMFLALQFSHFLKKIQILTSPLYYKCIHGSLIIGHVCHNV